jgi:hypothetical protein
VTGSDPADLVIQVATVQGPGEDPLTVESSTAFHGVLYAPQASLQVGSDFEVFGALVGKQVTFSGPANVHFDKHLASAAAASELPGLITWWIVDLKSAPSVAANPFEDLGLAPSAMASPSGALEDQFLTIDYYDASDVYHTYSGPESGFDWSLVKKVISAERDGETVLYPRSTTPRTGAAKHPGTLPVVDVPL